MSWTYHRRVRYYETDRMGVVHHSNYLRLIEDARMDWLDANIMNYKQMEDLGVIIPCAAASEHFLAFLRYDDPFSVEVKLVQYSGVRMVFRYEVRNTDTDVLCYTGESTHFFSSDSRRTGKEYAPIAIKHILPELHQKFLNLVEKSC